MRASEMALFRYMAIFLALLMALPAAAQAPGNHIDAQLVAESPPTPGETMTVALVFDPEEGWHGYWSNPGDAGYGMTLDWNLPEGWEAGEPQYPVPETLVISGLMNHVYEGEYAVLVPIEVPEGASVANWAPITVDADWLACTDEICVPEGAMLTLRVSQPGEGNFDAYREALPPLLDSMARLEFTEDQLRLGIPLPASMRVRDPHVFIAEDQVIDYAAPQSFYREGDMLIVEIPRGGLERELDSVSGIIALDGARDGLRFTAVPGEVPTGGRTIAGGAAGSDTGLLLLALGALAGGLLLNLMPCVFPILSLKALTLARAGESEAQARREGLAYTAGVVIACLALGGLLLLLRAGGTEIGWAFQLQEPGVVVALLVIAVAITANFAGLYELPSLSVTRSGSKSSAFSTGLLAAFVATPCTGPFMAAALGGALLLPWEQALLLFAALGFGLALPFLAIGCVPALRCRLPKPGPWMNRFRKIMAIPMGLTALALAWLTWRVGGWGFALLALGVAGLAVALLAIAGPRQWTGRMRRPAYGILGAVAMVALVPLLWRSYDPPAASAESLLDPAEYSEAALAEARASGRPVFLWFTADWCLTCKVNESVAIEREVTREAFEDAGVIAMRGDWTRRDAEITRFLTEQGAAGVPLYIWYPPGGGEGEQLPQVLTPGALVELTESS